MKILFQGDSITDTDRDRTKLHDLTGYTKYVAEILGDGNEYINKGVAMDKSRDVLNRFDADIKPFKPDIMTLLVGTNDVWHAFNREEYTSPEQYAKTVEEILLKTREISPNVKFILLEPYLLPAPEKTYWRSNMINIIDACRRVAVKYADEYVALDGLFAEQWVKTPWQELAADGVHPTDKGHQMIAKYLAEAILRVQKKYNLKQICIFVTRCFCHCVRL